MRKVLVFSRSKETMKSYLTRAAAILNILRGAQDRTCEYPEIAGMNRAEIKEFEEYLCRLIRPEVEKAAYLAARKASILDYKEVIANMSLAYVMEVFHRYNDSSVVSVPGGHSFDAFISNIIKSSVREAFMEKTGLKKHQLDKANRIRKAISYAAALKHICPEEVTIEEIFEAQKYISRAVPISVDSIKEVLEYMETEVYYDGLEDFEIEDESDPYKGVVDQETKAALHEAFMQMRAPQRYIFLKRFLSGEDRSTYKQLAKETKLIELCKEDPVCMRNLTRGDLTIARPKGNAVESEEYKDVVYVKIDFLDYLFRDALKRIKQFVTDNGLLLSDMEGWLNDWIYEEMAEF